MTPKNETSTFEKFLFRFTRIFAIVGSVLALIGITLLLLNLFNSDNSEHVSFAELNIQPAAGNSSPSEVLSQSSDSINYPDSTIMNKYFAGDNEQVLKTWLGNFNDVDKKQNFLNNLEEVIKTAEQKDANVTKTINNYKEVKFSKLQKSPSEEYKELGQKFAIYTSVFGLIIFIALMSLILLMFAIERNTRYS